MELKNFGNFSEITDCPKFLYVDAEIGQRYTLVFISADAPCKYFTD